MLGMLTDRDIVSRSVVKCLHPDRTHVRDVMTTGAVWCSEDQTALEAAEIIRSRGLRRLPVLDGEKTVVGLISLDDLCGKMPIVERVVRSGELSRPVPVLLLPAPLEPRLLRTAARSTPYRTSRPAPLAVRRQGRLIQADSDARGAARPDDGLQRCDHHIVGDHLLLDNVVNPETVGSRERGRFPQDEPRRRGWSNSRMGSRAKCGWPILRSSDRTARQCCDLHAPCCRLVAAPGFRTSWLKSTIWRPALFSMPLARVDRNQCATPLCR